MKKKLIFSLFCVALISCNPEQPILPDPTPKPTPENAVVTVGKITDTAWYKGSVTVSWKCTNASTVTANGKSVSASDSLTLTNLTADTDVVIEAKGTNGGSSDTKTAHIKTLDQYTTMLGNGGQWRLIERYDSSSTSNHQWETIKLKDCILDDRIVFYKNGTLMRFYNTLHCNDGEEDRYASYTLTYNSTTKALNWGGIPMEVIELSENRLVLVQIAIELPALTPSKIMWVYTH